MKLLNWNIINNYIFVIILLLQDGITDELDMSLRDFSALCLKEFVVWSIKHTPHSEMSNSPLNIKRILRQIYAFSQHPCPFKRLGESTFMSPVVLFVGIVILSQGSPCYSLSRFLYWLLVIRPKTKRT